MSSALKGFDRDLQLDLLNLAVKYFPESVGKANIPDRLNKIDKNDLLQNLAYLQEEGLIKMGMLANMDGRYPTLELMRATNKAINLLTEDGGVSASLKVVTVKFHNDTISIIAEFISQKISDPKEKETLLSKLKNLSAESLNQVVIEVLKKGLYSAPGLLSSLLSQLP